MHVRLSVARFCSYTVLPALCFAVALYFGYHAVWGEGGYFALQKTRAELAQKQAELDRLSAQNKRLQHRIDLLRAKDPDLVEEIARTELMDGAKGLVAVPRDRLKK